MNNRKWSMSSHTFQSIIILLLLVAMIVFSVVDFHLFENIKDQNMITNSILRLLGGFVFMIIITGFGYSKLFKASHFWKSLIIIIPALIISINNFPIIAFLDGRAVLTEPVYRVFLFFIECLSTGFFEEIVFRGIILIYLVRRFAHLKNGFLLAILISSIIFGLVHIFNLYNGASIIDTLMQIGYSFLVGMMWAVMYLKTKNIWLVMLLHATFNFFGQVMFYLGNVDGRYDIYTIVVTIVLAIMVSLYVIKQYNQLNLTNTILKDIT